MLCQRNVIKKKKNLKTGVAVSRSGKIDFEAKALIKSDVA